MFSTPATPTGDSHYFRQERPIGTPDLKKDEIDLPIVVEVKPVLPVFLLIRLWKSHCCCSIVITLVDRLRALCEGISSRGEKRGPACQPFAFGRT